MPTSDEMRTYGARLATFNESQQIGKRRASSQSQNGTRKKNGQAAEWPHERPSPESLARAGFYFHPTQENPDNVRCFFCDVKLDGWEPDDYPLSEHISHSGSCSYARALHTAGRVKHGESHDPFDEEHMGLRTETFGEGQWPHEKKKGWKCRIKKMVEAGWVFDPSPEYDDMVTCFYCELSLDGWEPKDDPAEEHKKRAPECSYFSLVEENGGFKRKKAKKSTAGKRTSTTSVKSRLSTQSTLSAFANEEDVLGTEEEPIERLDDSIVSTGTTIVKTTKAKKQPRAKAATKPANGRKRANTVDSTRSDNTEGRDENEVTGRESHGDRASPEAKAADTRTSLASTTSKPARSTKSKKSSSKDAGVAVVKRSTIVEEDAIVSAQLQEELEQSLDQISFEATPPVPNKMRQGTKRTSDGLMKQVNLIENKQLNSQEFSAAEFPWLASIPAEMSNAAAAVAVGKIKRVVEKKGKSKKTSSSRSSAATVTGSQRTGVSQGRDTAKEDAEIEAELVRIEAEEKASRGRAVEDEVGAANEYEATPSRSSRNSQELKKLQREVEAETQGTPAITRLNSVVSPSGSDKENIPSSVIQPASSKHLPATITSPTKTVRLPLAPGTPNQAIMRSPTKFANTSKLASTKPWSSIDLDNIFLTSPQPTPGTVRQRLANAAGILTSPEKRMSIEEWVRWRAEKGEEQLRRQCEEMVGTFEKEGMRALQSLEGISLL